MMFRPGKKKRTAKQLFALLRQKIKAYCKSTMKSEVQMNHLDIIFEGDLPFKQKKQTIDYGEPSISKSDMQTHQQYLAYDFPLQTYRLKFDNSVLNLLKYDNIFNFTDQQLLNKKPLCITSYGNNIIVGWSNGIIMLFKLQNFKNIIWTRLPCQKEIRHVEMINNSIVASNIDNKIYLLELIGDNIKIMTNHQYIGPSISRMKSCKINNTIITFISDSDGNFSRLSMKKILLIQSNSIKLLFQGSQMIFEILPQNLFKLYQNRNRNSIILVTNDSTVCKIINYDSSNDDFTTIFTLQNFMNYNEPNFNNKFLSLQFMQYIDHNGIKKLMVACSFSNRLFFIICEKNKQTDNYQFQFSRRVKLKDNIVELKYLGKQKYLIITESTIFYCLISNTVQFQVFSNFQQLKTISLKLNSKFQQNMYNHMICSNNKLIWLQGNRVQCCKIMNWNQLYSSIANTQGLYLLYFIIVSKYMKSKYLELPQSFKGLQEPFLKTTIEEKQILLEFYYLMKMPPPQDFTSLDQLSNLLLPFIFNHQLDNLSNNQLEYLVKYWQNNRVLIVEEIIMSGIDKGWDVAIKNAWMRSLIKIAKMGEDYQFPLLKMCGYFVLNQNDEQMAAKYAKQIILYMKLGINKQLQQIEDEEEYQDMIKIFVKILLDKQMYLRLSKYHANKVVSIFTDLFRGESLQCILKMPMEGFILGCTGEYSPFIMNRHSVEQIIYSHCIGTLSKNRGQQIQKRLICQQAILTLENYFQFTKERTLQILIALIQDEKLLSKATKIQYKPIVLDTQQLQVKSQELALNLLFFLKSKYKLQSEQFILILQLCQKSRNLQLVSIDIMKSQKRYQTILQKFISCKNRRIKYLVFDWLNDITMQLLKQQQIEPDSMRDFNRVVLNRMKQFIQLDKEKTRQYIQTFFKNSERKLINRIENDPQLQLEYVELVLENQLQPDQQLANLHISLLCKLNSQRIIDIVQNNSSKYDLDTVLEVCLQYPGLNTVIIYLYQKVGDIDMAVEKHLDLFFDQWTAMKSKRNETLFCDLQGDALIRANDAISVKINSMFQNIVRHLYHILDIIHRQPNPLQPYKKVSNKLNSIYFMEQQQIHATRIQDKMFIDKLTQLLGIIIMDLAKQGQIDFLIDQVLLRYKTMDLRQMKKHIGDVYSCLLSSRTVIENILQINRQQLIQSNLQTRSLMSKSSSAQGTCALCEVTIMDGEIALLFSCGHLYHLHCSQCQDEVDYCVECIFTDVINGMIRYPDLLLDRLLAHRKYRKNYRNVSTIRNMQNKKKHQLATNRKLTNLTIFDKKINELAIQTEIIELKLQSKSYHK